VMSTIAAPAFSPAGFASSAKTVVCADPNAIKTKKNGSNERHMAKILR